MICWHTRICFEVRWLVIIGALWDVVVVKLGDGRHRIPKGNKEERMHCKNPAYTTVHAQASLICRNFTFPLATSPGNGTSPPICSLFPDNSWMTAKTYQNILRRGTFMPKHITHFSLCTMAGFGMARVYYNHYVWKLGLHAWSLFSTGSKIPLRGKHPRTPMVPAVVLRAIS